MHKMLTTHAKAGMNPLHLFDIDQVLIFNGEINPGMSRVDIYSRIFLSFS